MGHYTPLDEPEPNRADEAITGRLREALRLVEVRVLVVLQEILP